jgi:hypothetical protein
MPWGASFFLAALGGGYKIQAQPIWGYARAGIGPPSRTCKGGAGSDADKFFY